MPNHNESISVVVREFHVNKDTERVVTLENTCEVGPTNKLSLYTDMLGDPICRLRNSPSFLMLVAEIGEEIVGMIRGCIKTVACGKSLSRSKAALTKQIPLYTKLAYILGLRVSPNQRRMGIGLKLVKKMEAWFKDNGAEYSYMATESENLASVKLFTEKCGYLKFRTPSILVNPVYAHRTKVSRNVTIIPLTPSDAVILYRNRFSTIEFFPRDIDSVLNNKLSLGTFLAVPCGSYSVENWPGPVRFLLGPPCSWAVLSVWNSKEVFKLEVRGASRVKRAFAKTTRVLDRAFPWLKMPSVPDLFRPFGFHFLYGLGGEGPKVVKMVRALCGFAHNIAMEYGCGVVATEVASCEPLRLGIPHWKMLSCAEDLWCIKRLVEDYSNDSVGDWTKSVPGISIFVDPRDV
ncbi:probable N-acetyltransferase HLS1-like [Lathyrus oleraceus]|uniref:N-acetyltransferase domain-containing protein n=2 Tax=Pisum sativum TaxID=3888 RepID=A0A9D4YH25_PEA|nr:probable N-acetyltransferase HLS1-like [Pisum sativum]KAI5439423.1 hypothetical protein KIW84_024992 [Pisum sativum]